MFPFTRSALAVKWCLMDMRSCIEQGSRYQSDYSWAHMTWHLLIGTSTTSSVWNIISIWCWLMRKTVGISSSKRSPCTEWNNNPYVLLLLHSFIGLEKQFHFRELLLCLFWDIMSLLWNSSEAFMNVLWSMLG